VEEILEGGKHEKLLQQQKQNYLNNI